MSAVYFSFQCFVIAYVYAELLIQDGHLLHPLYKRLEKRLTKRIRKELPDTTPDEVRKLPGYEYKPVYKIEAQKHWLLKALGGCVYCTSGQLSLWALAGKFFLYPALPPFWQQVLSTLWQALFCICLTILMVITYKKLQEKWSR